MDRGPTGADAAGYSQSMTPQPEAPPARQPIVGVLFDIDDTLVDTRQAFAQAIEAVARVWLPHLPQDRRHEALAQWRTDPGGHFRAYTRGEVDFDTQRRRRADDLQEAFGGEPLDDERYADWLALFWGTYSASFVAHRDARPTLDRLHAVGMRVGALTNAATAMQGEKLARTGFPDVRVLVGVDTLGVGKPDRRAFLEACRRLGTEPGRTAYVGDELVVDAHGAAAAGLVGVWLDRPGSRRGGQWREDEVAARAAGLHVISGLDELPVVLGIDRSCRSARA